MGNTNHLPLVYVASLSAFMAMAMPNSCYIMVRRREKSGQMATVTWELVLSSYRQDLPFAQPIMLLLSMGGCYQVMQQDVKRIQQQATVIEKNIKAHLEKENFVLAEGGFGVPDNAVSGVVDVDGIIPEKIS